MVACSGIFRTSRGFVQGLFFPPFACDFYIGDEIDYGYWCYWYCLYMRNVGRTVGLNRIPLLLWWLRKKCSTYPGEFMLVVLLFILYVFYEHKKVSHIFRKGNNIADKLVLDSLQSFQIGSIILQILFIDSCIGICLLYLTISLAFLLSFS